MAGPSVQVGFATRLGSSSSIGAGTGRYFVAGLFERGRTDSAVRVTSFREFTDRFGARVAYSAAWDSLRMFFAEGGSEAVVARIVGAAATVGTKTFKDAAAADSIRIDALGAGAWSADVSVEITAGSMDDTVRAIVTYLDQIEVFDNATSAADLANKLNQSLYVRGVDLGGGLPAVAAAAALSAGADDRAAVVTQTYVTGLDKFPAGLGAGAVALPGQTADLVGASLIAHAKATRRVALLAPKVGATQQELVVLAKTLVGVDGKYAMLVAPWVRISDRPGGTLLVSPEGYVAGARARAHTRSGPWAAAAGSISASTSIVAVEREVQQSEYDTLSDVGVSLIVTRAGRIVLYGYRSLDVDSTNYRLLSAQDTLNWLAQRCEDSLEPFVFAPIDGNGGLLGQVEGVLRGILEDVRLRGGLYARVVDGDMVDPGYSVDVGNSVNTTESLAQNILRAQVAVRLAPHAELIEITIIRVALTASV